MIWFIAIALPLLWSQVVDGRPTDNCPFLGPSFPYSIDLPGSEAIRNASAHFPDAIEALFESEVLNRTHVSFTIDVFSTATNQSIYSFSHEGSSLNGTLTTGVLDENTIFRIGSVSKLYTTYALILVGGYQVLEEPVTKYIPELAGNLERNPIDNIRWEDVTIGSLAAHQAGAGGASLEIAGCFGNNNCSASAQIDQLRDLVRPTTAVGQGAIYSDGGYALLGRVLERMTGTSYQEAVLKLIGEPLGLNSTTTIEPGPDSNSFVVTAEMNNGATAWAYDNQITAGSGGWYSTNSDMRKVGLSILNSELLSPAITKRWMKPRALLSSMTHAIGAPWEINRVLIPVSPGSDRTRVSDLYTKGGGNPPYGSILALSPDHGIGYSIMISGIGSSPLVERWDLRNIIGEIFLPAAEHAMMDNAARNFAGTFVDPSAGNTNMTLTVDNDKPGIGVESWFLNGTDILYSILSPVTPRPASALTVRLYPNGIVESTSINTTQHGFLAAPQSNPVSTARSSLEGGTGGMFDTSCETWFAAAFNNFNGLYPDLFVFEAVNGRLQRVKNVLTGSWLERV